MPPLGSEELSLSDAFWLERTEPPERGPGSWLWRAGRRGLEIRFEGGVSPADRDSKATGKPEARDGRPALDCWVEQVHGIDLLEARPGRVGKADGIWLREAGLVAKIFTADCLPAVLDGGPSGVAVVHAGWRGLAAGILSRAVHRLGGVVRAWIGPSIGPCCYEVGPEVASAVAAGSSPGVVRPGPRGRPHLDLGLAAAFELERAGVRSVELWRLCTRCHPEWLASYRRDGAGCGRNVASAWLVEDEKGG